MAGHYFEAGNDKNYRNKLFFWLPIFSSYLEFKFKEDMQLGAEVTKLLSNVSLLFTAHLRPQFKKRKLFPWQILQEEADLVAI